jgi:hypothetical protein
MRLIIPTLLAVIMCQPAFAQPDQGTYRPVSFICRDGGTGTSVKIEENVLGQRKLYEVSYFKGKPTLFVISYANNGRAFKRIGLIDLSAETDPDDLDAAKFLAAIMRRDAARFCNGSRRDVMAARHELQANHAFNRSHPRYRGR